MKIWCLKCGKVLAQTEFSETTNVKCPCCGEKIAYSVKGNTGYIASLTDNLAVNNTLYILANYNSVN